MDNCIVAMEEIHRISDSAASASKLGSLVHINSIAIDISTSATEEMCDESPTHEHFSMRGFVAGMRKKDRKTCLPFAPQGNDVDLVGYLPPLLVPRFRWWQCSNCLPDSAKKSTEEMVVADRDNVGTSTCRNVGGKACLFLEGRENIGNKLGLRDNADEEENHPGSKEKTDVRDKEAASPSALSEANPLLIRDRLNNTADASDMVCLAERPSCIVDELENASSGRDGPYSELPHRRKPKLRSLADIMVEEKNPTGDNPRTKSASSSGMQITYTETETVLGPHIELDVPADVAKASRSPERKRKIALEEDRGPLGLICLSAVAKRKCRRVETSNSESEGNATMRFDLQLGERTHQTKPKRDKALDISKKMKQTHTGDGTIPKRVLCKISAKLQKHVVSGETSYDKLGHAPSILGEMGPCFRTIQSGQQIQRKSNVLNKMPGDEAYHDPLMRPSKSTLGDCNIKGKVALDLSINSFRDAERNSNSEVSCRQHRDIPDLNEEFHQKTAMTHGKQLSAFFEKRSWPLHKTLFFHDVSASSSKEKAREGKKQLGVAKPQNKDSHMELGASDDIPMEIVELLAKNQHDRALGNSRRHINNSPRGYGALYVDGHPDVVNFPPANRRNGLTVADRNMGFGQNNISANFPPLNNCQLDMRKPEESQFRLFTSSTPGQHRKTQFSASSSIMTEARNSAGAEILWSLTRENAPPFRFSIPQNHSSQQNNMGVNLFSDQRNKGKIICNIKDNQDKRAVHKKGRIVSGSTSVGSLDPYSNDTIPAMQLLSLMDQQVVSGSSFELGTKSFLDKPFSPCTHHARLNGKENHKFLGGSFFPQNNHSKDFSGFRFGAYSSAESSKKVSSYLQGQVPLELRNSKINPSKCSSNLAIRPAKSDSALGVCTLNRNPADFSIPDARNEFTISAKDLKPRKRNVSKEKSRLVNGEARKRQRMKKDATGKECSRK